jgi:3',5'-cyclic AMP phosphodiesterase CpdA
MIIAQITDLHVVARGERCLVEIDTNRMLAEAVAHLNAFDPKIDVVLATGDLTDHGRPEEYAMLREILEPLEIPLHLIPGNHDERDVFLEAFSDCDYLPDPGAPFAHYTIDEHPVRLVGLDTTTQGVDEGRICDERLSWLDEQLSSAPERPTLVFMHHPPFETGIQWMDGDGLHGGRRLAEVVRRHPQVERVICGHIHRPILARWAGTVASVAPGTAHQLDLAVRGVRAYTISKDPAAVALHLWQPPLGFVSHLSFVATGGPYRPDFALPDGWCWDEIESAAQRRYERMKSVEYTEG